MLAERDKEIEEQKKLIEYYTKQVPIQNELLQERYKEIERLKEDNEYLNYCNDKLTDTNTNLKYKITTLEDRIKELRVDNTEIPSIEDLMKFSDEKFDELTKIAIKETINEELNKKIKEQQEEIERLKKENEELKHKLKLKNSYLYGYDIDSLGSDKE
jgi:uncharacterized coiled-coil protein SlyX